MRDDKDNEEEGTLKDKDNGGETRNDKDNEEEGTRDDKDVQYASWKD